MSSLVLLNSEGEVARKLQFVSLPENFVVPEGMTVSWKEEIEVSSRDPLDNIRHREPPLAYFYLGDAWGQVRSDGFKELVKEGRFANDVKYACRTLTIAVQARSAGNLNKLRDKILGLIQSGNLWGVSTDFNPKPKKSFFRRWASLCS